MDRLRLLLWGAALSLVLPAAAERPRFEGPGVRDPLADRELEAAQGMRRRGDFAAAAAAYESFAEHHPHSRRWAQALTAAAELHHWQLEAPAAAARLYERALEAPSDLPGVMPALTQRLSLERDRGGSLAELELIEHLLLRRSNAEYAPYLLLRAAKLLDSELHDPARALETAQRAVVRAAKTSWSDDALFLEASLLRRVGRAPEALRAWRQIIASQEPSLIVGEYDSDLLDDAYYQVAVTLEASDPRAAEEAYRAVAAEVPASVWVDDALWSARRLAQARGDAAQAAKDLERLTAARPASRHLKARAK